MRPTKPFKNNRNQWYTSILFWDHWINRDVNNRPVDPVFTYFDDKPGLINGRKTFVDMGDPTGYKWAMEYLGDWEHFLILERSSFFKPVLAKWRAELQMKMTSEAIDRIRIIAESDDKQSLVANKYLAERTWEKAGTTRGRPTKAEVQGELRRHVQIVEQEDEDMARIGLKVVK